MFLPSTEIEEKVKSIILDDVDNDIIFIVGNKGVGKTQLIYELYRETSFNSEVIVTDGKHVFCNTSNLAKCFIEGIEKYVERNNSQSIRRKLCHEIGEKSIGLYNTIVFTCNKSLNFALLLDALSRFPISKLKSIYYKIAGATPLVIVSSSMYLSTKEVDYLCNLPSDTSCLDGARVTFIFGIHADSNSIKQMNRVSKSMEKRTWILPLLPEVTVSYVTDNPNSVAKLSLSEVGEIDSIESFQNKVSSSNVYFEMFSAVIQITNNELSPYYLFLLANQEISLSSYYYLLKTYKIRTEPEEKRLTLPKDGKILWLDVVSYYYALLLKIDEAIIQTQKFFLVIIKGVLNQNNNCYCRHERNAFISFIKEASAKKNNQLAQPFSDYYSSFATMAKVLFRRKVYDYYPLKDILDSLKILDRVTIDFSEDSIQALFLIYESTQLCFLIDIGIEIIQAYIASINPKCSIPLSEKDRISSFFHFSMYVAYKWSDVTIVDGILKLEQVLIARGEKIRFYHHEPVKESLESALYSYFLDKLSKYNINLGDINMKGSIFLSYTHDNFLIADAFDNQLQIMVYEVKRDVRDAVTWSSLKEYMNRIRFEDNIVFLVSDSFLRKDSCIYEVMQFMKDETRVSKAFPVVIEFSDIQRKQRESEGKVTSMFSVEYHQEIVKFWQERANKLEKLYQELDPENVAEFAQEYRERKNMAQAASQFINMFFCNMVVGTYKLQKKVDNERIAELVVKIDNRIQNL